MKNSIDKTNKYAARQLNEYIFVLDADELDIPEAWKNLIGYNNNEIDNSINGLFSVLNAISHDAMTAELTQIVNGRYNFKNKEISVKCRDGSSKWFALQSEIEERDHSGKPCKVLLIFTNISEAKIEELRALQERWMSDSKLFRTVIDIIPDSLYVKDIAGRKIIANPQELKYMGLSSETEAIGKTDFDIYPKELAEKFTAVDDLVLKGGEKIINNIDEIVQKGQKTRWLLSSKVPLRNEQDEIIGLVGIGRDISERHEMLADINRTKERLQKIILSSSDIVWEMGLDTKMIFCSEQIEKITGYTQAEAIGQSVMDYLSPAERERMLAHFSEIVQKKECIVDYEYCIAHKNGQEVYILTNAFPNFDKEGNLIGYIGVDKDITARKKAEQQIHKSERFFKLISELNDIVLNSKNENELYSNICNVAVNTGKFVFAWVGIFDPDLQIIKPLVWAGNDSGYLSGIKAAAVKKEKKDRGPIIDTIISGKYFVSNDIATDPALRPWRDEALKRGLRSSIILPLIINGTPAAALTIYADRPFFFNEAEQSLLKRVSENIGFALTAMKSNDERIAANNSLKIKTEELTNTNIELERFAYVASHDLQEPLRMIANFLELFEKKYNDVVDDTGKKYIHFAVDGALRMKNMITDLLQYSRAGSGTLKTEDVDMNLIMKDVLLLFRNELYQANVNIIVEPLPVIRAGRIPMLQLMQNLLSNAIKFRGKEDPVITVSGKELEHEWLISVKDNGIGIDPEFAEKIFIVFQRLHSKEEYSGTGIGLSICKKIAERYNGKIWVESASGKGACFTFSLPKYSYDI